MITHLTVYLDDNRLETMDHGYRCGTVVAATSQGKEKIFTDVLDSTPFFHWEELVEELAGRFRLPRTAITVCA